MSITIYKLQGAISEFAFLRLELLPGFDDLHELADQAAQRLTAGLGVFEHLRWLAIQPVG